MEEETPYPCFLLSQKTCTASWAAPHVLSTMKGLVTTCILRTLNLPGTGLEIMASLLLLLSFKGTHCL